MAVVAWLVHTGTLNPPESLAWVGSWWFLFLASSAAVVEFFGDKVPALDHALHAVHFVLAPLVGGITAMTGYHGDPTVDVILGVLGGGSALLIHSARSGIRLISSAGTLGVANPFISIIEDMIAVCFILIAILAPLLTMLLLLAASIWAFKKVNRMVVARRNA